MTTRKYSKDSYSHWEDGKLISWFRTYEQDGEIYVVEVQKEGAKRPIVWDDYKGSKLNKADLFPRLLPTYKRAHPAHTAPQIGPQDGACFHKQPAFDTHTTASGGPSFPDVTRKEIETCEKLAQHPHPNVLQYHGVIPDSSGEYVFALCFDKYETDLREAVDGRAGAQGSKLDLSQESKAKIMSDVKSALSHLHGLGYVHNDVNPTNILLQLGDNRSVGKAVLADFDSSVLIDSKRTYKAGTEGFYKPTETCTPQNDWYGWEKTCEFLGGSNTIDS